MLRLVVPEGGLERSIVETLKAADLKVVRTSGSGHGAWSMHDPRVVVVSVFHPQHIPTYVAAGIFDAGIAGEEWIEETDADVVLITPVEHPGDTHPPPRVVLGARRTVGVTSSPPIRSGARIATEFPTLTRRYFEGLGMRVRILGLGWPRGTRLPGTADAIVEVVEGGGSVARDGFEIVDVLLEPRTHLIANPSSYDYRVTKQEIEELAAVLRGS